MILLHAANHAEIIQTLIPIGTLILAVVSLFQNLKVETLTQTNTRLAAMVTQLANQTDLLSKEYQLQLQLTEQQRRPYFVFDLWYIWNAGGPEFQSTLRNIGTPAAQVEFIAITEGLEVYNSDGSAFYTRVTAKEWPLVFKTPDINNAFTFSFYIQWSVPSGESFRQRVDIINGQIHMRQVERFSSDSAFQP